MVEKAYPRMKEMFSEETFHEKCCKWIFSETPDFKLFLSVWGKWACPQTTLVDCAFGACRSFDSFESAFFFFLQNI